MKWFTVLYRVLCIVCWKAPIIMTLICKIRKATRMKKTWNYLYGYVLEQWKKCKNNLIRERESIFLEIVYITYLLLCRGWKVRDWWTCSRSKREFSATTRTTSVDRTTSRFTPPQPTADIKFVFLRWFHGPFPYVTRKGIVRAINDRSSLGSRWLWDGQHPRQQLGLAISRHRNLSPPLPP